MGQYFSNEKLPSKVKVINARICGRDFKFLTDNGVFSKDRIDFGSRLLLESIPQNEVGAKVLDVGCGYGTIGIVINKLTGATVDMVDVNRRAIHLALRNIKENDCSNINAFLSNCYESVNCIYDTIITNPPIRAGKGVVYEIVMGANRFLNDSGKLFLVVRKEQGAKSLISKLNEVYNVEIIEKKSGYFIIKCSKKI